MTQTTISALTKKVAQLSEIKAKISAETATLKRLKSSQAAIEEELLDYMGDKILAFNTTYGTAHVREENVAHVEDWNLLHDYIKEHNVFHLLQRRVSNVAYREMLDMDEEIPGVTTFTKRTIGLTKPKSS